MNLQDVMSDPIAQDLVRGILADVGLEKAPRAYDGPTALQTRCDAANKLAASILVRERGGAIISPPVNDIIKVVTATAKGLENRTDTLTLTHEVMSVALYGHIWIGRLIKQKSSVFNQIMAKDGVLAILNGLIGFGPSSGGCNSGGGGDCGSCNSGGGCGGCGSGGCGP
jgi:hypothetical protein